MDSEIPDTKNNEVTWESDARYESIAGDKADSEPPKYFRIGASPLWEIEEDIRLCLKLLGGADVKSPGCEAAKRALRLLNFIKHPHNRIF